MYKFTVGEKMPKDFIQAYDKVGKRETIKCKFAKATCPLNDKCLKKYKYDKIHSGRYVLVALRYDAVLHDMKRVETEAFKEAMNKRYKVERRFATMVRNHGLRRCRYLRPGRAKIHITLANMACNIVRMVNLLCQPSFAASRT